MNKAIDRTPGANLIRGLAACTITALIIASPLRAQTTEETSAMARGAAVYGNMCGRCHNPRSPLERDDRDWVTIIQHMRIRGNLTGGQVENVLAFLQATNNDPSRAVRVVSTTEATARHIEASNEPISSDPALASLGEALMTQRACIGCHIVGGGGGNVGPSLNGVTGRRDVQYLRQKLIDPTVDNATSMMPNLSLTADEIEAILTFLATLGDENESATSSGGR